ncbi:MAG: nucleotidyl transferase AbiEii/AbiGii toxin family protein [Elusimicrobia bacterium]|nr:nucleotidyl transferase AbiEii/AbiGii toxin family protein [Elusimicrobiota bacterium]
MLDYLGIFGELNKSKVAYVLVGGIAVNLHGIPRMTYDVDLLLELSDKNLAKFLKLAQAWGFKPRVPVGIMELAQKEKREDWIKNKHMKAFCLVNPAWAISEIDIVIDSPVDYAKAAKNAERIKLKSLTVPVIALEDLIKMKRNTGRKQDAADIRYLRGVKK